MRLYGISAKMIHLSGCGRRRLSQPDSRKSDKRKLRNGRVLVREKEKKDMLERTVKTTDALGNETNTTYDAMGRVSTVSGKIDGGDSVTAYTYDGNGNVIKESVTSNKPGETTAYRNTYYQYDSMNRLIKTNTDEPGETLYEYDDNGNVTKMTTGAVNGAGGVSTTYEYDSQNRLVKTTDPMGYTETYTYDNNGNVASMTDKNGTVTTNTYNAVNSLLTSVAGNETISYTYKPYSGRQSAVTNSGGTISYTYNTKGQLTGETSTAENAAKTYTYDKDGNQTNITVTKNNNQIINQTASYNYVGNMTSVYDNKEEKTLVNYSYDGNGNMIEKKTADGMHKTVYDYNESNLLTKIENMTIYDKETNQFGSYSSYEYEYYLDGNRSKETENTGKNKEYTYDGAGRLKTERYDETGGLSSWANKYEYDARGNRAVKEIVEGTKETVDDFVEETGIYTATTLSLLPELTSWAGYAKTYYTYDNNNRLTFEKWYDTAYMNRESSYTYDNNGNLKNEYTETWYDNFAPEDPTIIHYPDDDISYSYNGMNQLIEVERNGEEYNYVYDGKGQRVKKTLNGKTIEYVWDGSGNIIGENEKVYSRGAGGEIVSDGENYYAYNGHGDTTNLVQMSSGTSIALTATYEYDAFGNAQITGNESAGNPFRYNGQYTDEETGLIYLRNRYYDPSIGRFTQEDPYWNVNNMIYGEDGNNGVPSYASIVQSANLYVYCVYDPVNMVDPSGKVPYELFSSPLDAAIDWGWNFYAKTDYSEFEQISIIYQISNGSEIYYCYGYAVDITDNQDSRVNTMGPHFVDPSVAKQFIPEVSDGWQVIEFSLVHSQANERELSDYDIAYVDSGQYVSIYGIVPTLYDPNLVDVTVYHDTREGYREEIVYENLRYDRSYLTSERRESIRLRYESAWKAHVEGKTDVCAQDFPCPQKKWPNDRW